jgi:V/A-type H+-transporting ATPase subunit I
MPVSSGVDPTVCLAPFFMMFFGICLADVGYGLVMAAVMLWLIKKTQGDKKPLWMFLICAAITVPAGAVTGSWFGDAVPTLIPVLGPLRAKLMLFDPIGEPTILFKLAVILGYIQLMTGLAIAFVHNLKQKSYIAAVCENLTWLVMLNCIVIFGLSKAGMAPTGLGRFLGLLAIAPAVTILLFSHRQGRWAERIGMGAYNLFSAVFYLGDVLSYFRLAALCMVSSGIAMAINIIAKISLDIPYGLGVLAFVSVLVLGHALNLVLSALSAFVHTLRLQYVEYFTKFFVGGGKLFEPLRKDYKYIYVK